MDLNGKLVLITGASKGLGKSLALGFAKEGCNLILNARGKDELGKVSSACIDIGVKCDLVSGSLAGHKTIESLAKIADEKGINILINNAGMILVKPFEETTEKELYDIFSLNTFAPMNLTRILLPSLKKNSPSQIINIASNAAVAGRKEFTLYSATKFALRGFTDSLRQETNKDNVKVMGVYPGGIKTELFSHIENYDMSGFMDPDEVAGIIIDSCKTSSSASVDDIVINRTNK